MNDKQVVSVYELRNRYDPDLPHSEQVKKLAIRLYDSLADLHNMSDRERELLRAASLLHDIGYAIGSGREHHLNSAKLILEYGIDGFDRSEVEKIACIACLHRKKSNLEECLVFNSSRNEDRELILKLASLLRIADGLDRTHRGSIKDIRCELGSEVVTIYLKSDFSIDEEIKAADKKAELFRKVFSKEVIFLPDVKSLK